MKKIWILLFILTVCLTGCAKTEKIPMESPDEPIDTSGTKAVFYHGNKDFPISFTIDGEQQIQNGTYWYYELSNEFKKDWNESFYTYDKQSLDLNGSCLFGEFKKDHCFATNGGWPLFLTPVHTEYTISNQKKVDKTIANLAKLQLQANQIKEDAVVTDVWLCDLDQDGTEEQLFLAKNEDAEKSRYCFLGYANGENCQVLEGFFNIEKLPEIQPIICDFEGDGKWSVLLHKTAGYQCFSIFDFENGTFIKCYDVIF